MSSSELACFVIHPGTGEILRQLVCSPPSFEAMQAAGEELRPVEDGIADDTHFWDFLAREWRAYPPRPGTWAEFDFMARQWIDPRSAADMQAALFAAREAATLDKSELLMRLAMPGVGILSPEEAIEAAQGRIPASFQPAIASLPAEAQMLARIKWAGDQIISRTNPLLILAAYAKGISDEQMDQIFGVVAPV